MCDRFWARSGPVVENFNVSIISFSFIVDMGEEKYW